MSIRSCAAPCSAPPCARRRPAGRRAKRLPAKPVTLIVPFPAGGSADRHLRIVAQDASSTWASPSSWKTGRAPAALWGRQHGQTAKPDGYTISLYTLAMLRMPYMHKTHWDPINDFTFLIGLSGYTFGFTVRADSPYRTFNATTSRPRAGPRQHRLRLDRRGRRRLLMEEVARKRRRPAEPRAVQGQCRHAAGAVGRTRDGAKRRHRLGPVRRRRQDAPPGHFRRAAHHALARRAHGQELGYKVVSTSPYGLAGPKGMDPAVVRTCTAQSARAVRPASLEVMQQLNQQPAYRDSQDYREWARATYARKGPDRGAGPDGQD